jgi:hypothetical protein
LTTIFFFFFFYVAIACSLSMNFHSSQLPLNHQLLSKILRQGELFEFPYQYPFYIDHEMGHHAIPANGVDSGHFTIAIKRGPFCQFNPPFAPTGPTDALRALHTNATHYVRHCHRFIMKFIYSLR